MNPDAVVVVIGRRSYAGMASSLLYAIGSIVRDGELLFFRHGRRGNPSARPVFLVVVFVLFVMRRVCSCLRPILNARAVPTFSFPEKPLGIHTSFTGIEA